MNILCIRLLYKEAQLTLSSKLQYAESKSHEINLRILLFKTSILSVFRAPQNLLVNCYPIRWPWRFVKNPKTYFMQKEINAIYRLFERCVSESEKGQISPKCH